MWMPCLLARGLKGEFREVLSFIMARKITKNQPSLMKEIAKLEDHLEIVKNRNRTIQFELLEGS